MIKGARKEMIVVRTGNSRYFDEAYLVLKEDAQKERGKRTDILTEANRILAEITPEFSTMSQKKHHGIFFFVAGSLCGLFFGLLMTLLLV